MSDGPTYYLNPGAKHPNGCADEEHYKQCVRNGYFDGHSCRPPDDNKVDKNTGYPICPYSPNAIPKKDYKKTNDARGSGIPQGVTVGCSSNNGSSTFPSGF